MSDTPKAPKRRLIVDLPDDENDDGICLERVKELLEDSYVSGTEPFWHIETTSDEESDDDRPYPTADQLAQIKRCMFEAGEDDNDDVLNTLHEAAEGALESLLKGRFALTPDDNEAVLVAFKEGFWSNCHVQERKALRDFVVKMSRCRNPKFRAQAKTALKWSVCEEYDSDSSGIYQKVKPAGQVGP